MAYYKYPAAVQQHQDQLFDKLHTPGTPVPHSGIYRCAGCAKEIAANAPDPFPPQNHHQHSPTQGTIRWQLTVATQ